jgi:hypothetical protein
LGTSNGSVGSQQHKGQSNLEAIGVAFISSLSAVIKVRSEQPHSPHPPKAVAGLKRLHLCQQALVDRGANGGIVRNDCRIVARTGECVDLCGADDHKVDDLELVTAGAVVMTQKGPIIIIINQ